MELIILNLCTAKCHKFTDWHKVPISISWIFGVTCDIVCKSGFHPSVVNYTNYGAIFHRLTPNLHCKLLPREIYFNYTSKLGRQHILSMQTMRGSTIDIQTIQCTHLLNHSLHAYDSALVFKMFCL